MPGALPPSRRRQHPERWHARFRTRLGSATSARSSKTSFSACGNSSTSRCGRYPRGQRPLHGNPGYSPADRLALRAGSPPARRLPDRREQRRGTRHRPRPHLRGLRRTRLQPYPALRGRRADRDRRRLSCCKMHRRWPATLTGYGSWPARPGSVLSGRGTVDQTARRSKSSAGPGSPPPDRRRMTSDLDGHRPLHSVHRARG